MSLILNMLSRLIIAFLPMSNSLLISWLRSPSQWFCRPQNKVCHCFHCFSVYLPCSNRTRCQDLSISHQEASISSYLYLSEGRQNENHSHRKLTKLITWTIALCNSMKIWAMPCWATQDRWVMVESSGKTWSTGEGKGKPLQYSCLEKPMNSMKRQR